MLAYAFTHPSRNPAPELRVARARHPVSPTSRSHPSILAALLCMSSIAFSADTPTPPLANPLAALQARAPKENTYPDANPEFHSAVVRLVEGNTLASGADFFAAAQIASGPIPDYRSARMRYELTLAAVAKSHREAEPLLPGNWDALLLTLGRPMRLDVDGLAASHPGRDELTLDSAPQIIQSVLRNPAAARDIAVNTADNAELQNLVDADQAVRAGNWSKLSPAELAAVGAEDGRRNLRIREIVHRGDLHTAKDFANASLVMQHSSSFAGFQLAHELAVCALLLGDRGLGRWLVAATYDRMLNSLGHDQRFGTQGALTMKPQSPPQLRETDETGICDAERLALGCPTLAAKRANFLTAKPASISPAK